MNENNLNRIKGILSAKNGTLIPKFLGGFVIYHKSTSQPLYSKDGTSWFTDEDYMSPFTGSLDEFTEPELGLLFYTKNSIIANPSNEAISNPVNNKDFTLNGTTKPYNFIQNPLVGLGVENYYNYLKDNNLLESSNKPPFLDIIDLYNLNFEITGGIDTDPNGSVKAAAASNQQVLDKVQQTANDAAVEKLITETREQRQQRRQQERLVRQNERMANRLARIDARLARVDEKYGNTKLSPELAGLISQAGTVAMTAVGDVFAAKQMATDSDTTKTADLIYDGIAGAAEKMGPWGKVVGTAMKLGGAAGDMIQELGGGTDQLTKMDKWMDSFGVDQETMEQVGSSYGGTATSINEAAESADKKYGLFSSKARKKANNVIAKAKSDQELMDNIADTAADQRLLVSSMGEQAGLAYSMMTDGGYNQKYTYAAKQGGVLEWEPDIKLEWEPLVELNWELPKFKEGGNIDIIEELEWIPEFKSGGKTEKFDIPEIEETNLKNVIPEGALHKNKHHMEHAEGLTKKGIPVIDGEGEQLAEIEHSEIIFTLEVTKKLEEYYQIFYSEESTNKEKEQAALDAGKLLVYQILENTEDRTGLIESCKKGGSLILKKSTDDLIEEVLEWMPTITIIEEVIEEPEKVSKKDSEKESKKSEKELMKEAIKEVLIEILTK